VAGKFADGRYNYKPWEAPVEAAFPPQQYLGPFADNQDRLLTQALASQTMERAEISEYVRPPLPQVQLFPNRYGYINTEYGIDDIIEVSGRTPQRNEPNYSQSPGATQSTSRNTLGQV
jgi:hypothetical protein